MRYFLTLISIYLFLTSGVCAQPSDNWEYLYIDKKRGVHYIHPATVTRPSKDVVVFWSKWTMANGARYKFKNKLWRDRRFQLLEGHRGGKPMEAKFPTPIGQGKLDEIGEKHYEFFFPKDR